jgi:PKD repeat protein
MSRISWAATFALVSSVLLLSAGGAAAIDLQSTAATAAFSQENDQPTATFTHSPENPEPGETVTLNASESSDPDGEIVEYRWDLDGDGETDTTGGPNARVAFPSAGVYEVTLTVVDDDGATASVTNEIVVQGDIPPEASLTVSASEVEVGEALTFNASGSSDPDGQIETWAFDLNGNGTVDRTFESPPIFRTNYEEAGTYRVTLEVTDNDGLTDTATVEIIVQETTPETVTKTVTVSTPTTTTPITNVGEGPNTGGGSGLLDSFPGGGLGLAAVIVLLLLVIGGGALYAMGSSSGGARGGGARRRQSQSGNRSLAGVVVALVLTLLLIAGPVALLRRRGGSPPAAGLEVSLAFIELAALFVPALMLLLFVWFRLPQQLSQRGDATVGALSATAFRVIGMALGFLALVLVVVGLSSLLLTLTLPSTIAIAGRLIVGAVGLTAFALAIAMVSMAMG